MADPATIALAVKTAVNAAADKRTWKVVGVIIAAVLIPFILVIVMIVSLLSATADHNNAAINLSFNGGTISSQVPADYANYIHDMRDSFSKLDAAIADISAEIKDGSLDNVRVKAIFYSLFFGAKNLKMDNTDYRKFADCFVRYESRTRTVNNSDGIVSEEEYTLAVPLKSLPEIYANLERTLGRTISSEDKANALQIYYSALYGISAPNEGDGFNQWADWSPQLTPEQIQSLYHNLPEGSLGGEVVRLALTRLGDPYSQELRGKGNYTDCSYLTMWCYAKLGIRIPATAAEQGKFCAENGSTIAKKDLVPGDLIFWSYEPNGEFMNITHVGIYAGDGKVVDASSSHGQVMYRNLYDSDKQVLYGRPHILGQKNK
jgi:hypothetical protein